MASKKECVMNDKCAIMLAHYYLSALFDLRMAIAMAPEDSALKMSLESARDELIGEGDGLPEIMDHLKQHF